MKPARKTEVLRRQPARLTNVICRRVLAAGGDKSSGGSVRYGQSLQAPHWRPAPPPDPLPQTGEPFPPGPGLAACAGRDRGADPYDEIDVEFYLDSIGGE
jgi:hypothetical protein